MSKKAKWLIIILGALLVLELGAALGLLGYLKPRTKARNTMPETGLMVLTRQPGGELLLTWPEGINYDRYMVQVLRGEEVLSRQWTEEASCILPELPEGENLDILVSTAKGYRFFLGKKERIRIGDRDLKATVDLKTPCIENLTASADPENLTVTYRFDLDENSVCRMYRVESGGALTELHTLEQGEVTVTLGDTGEFPVPQGEEALRFAFDVYRFSPNMVYYGTVTEQTEIVREDLLQRDLALECTDLGNHVYTFTWGETKGDYYELQQFDPITQSWTSLSRVEPDQERTYTTGHLDRYSDFRFRVVAVGGQTMPDSKYAAISEEVSITTGNTAVFNTVWPMQELKLYNDVKKTKVLGKAKAVKALCVLEEKEGMFRVRVGEQEGYIDSNYCLINLPEYLGDLCLYDITNSYCAMYMLHEYEIPSITGQVLPGYGMVRLRRDQQLVPLLYPVAKKLEKAAKSAISQGYKLKIYDAYRPGKASKVLYDQVMSMKDQPLPQIPSAGSELTDIPQQETLAPTYAQYMTNSGQCTLNQILEGEKSRLNQGVALDVALTELSTGGNLPMPSFMYDLSWNSETANHRNAKKLASIMEAAGFTSQKSQWWHFYDRQTQNSLKPIYQMEGVTAEGWMADDQGWRYRRDDGEYYVNCTMTVDGVSCTFDEQGYLVTQ